MVSDNSNYKNINIKIDQSNDWKIWQVCRTKELILLQQKNLLNHYYNVSCYYFKRDM